MVATVAQKLVRSFGYEIIRATPALQFHSDHYTRHNARRLEHLASLRVPVAGLTVLEVGAGIGDHSHYYLDRGCRVTITEARPENLEYLRRRYPKGDIHVLDMDTPHSIPGAPFDLVHCYGLLYHLKNPEAALEFLAQNTRRMLFLETCVSFGEIESINPVSEVQNDVTQAWSGTGCRPTRPWLFRQLQSRFKHVYIPRTQPNHEEFPIDWTAPEKHTSYLMRGVFIASRVPIDNPMLAPELLLQQARQE